MIKLRNGETAPVYTRFCTKQPTDVLPQGWETLFAAEYGKCLLVPAQTHTWLLVGCGTQALGVHEIKELCAAAAKALKDTGMLRCVVDATPFWDAMQEKSLESIVLGLTLGEYQFSVQNCIPQALPKTEYFLDGIPSRPEWIAQLRAAQNIACGVIFARDMTNRPGNLLHPMDFARMTQQFLMELPIEPELLVYGQLKATGLNLLAGIGGSSEYPPCLLLLRYRGADKTQPITVLAGKGVTCDTGGYCLKKADSMAGIKGDMAGAAAVVGALYALAKNKVAVNVTACLPLCENRISQAALLPGDVITAYNGKAVEVLNTDAEGRLVLADAVAYAVTKEKPARIVDIATLTGSVWAALGYTITGALCDDETLYADYAKASAHTAERHLRFSFGKEHEKMLESTVADLKNIGGECCGTITAGLFIRAFAGGVPWLHLDIAGTAWVQAPIYAFEQPGATGVGVAMLYALMKGE